MATEERGRKKSQLIRVYRIVPVLDKITLSAALMGPVQIAVGPKTHKPFKVHCNSQDKKTPQFWESEANGMFLRCQGDFIFGLK